MDSIEILSPAKINLRLEVLKKRSDGYHDIRTILQRVNLCDHIKISLSKGGIDLRCEGKVIPSGPDNLAYHAAKSLKEEIPFTTGLRIEIKKRIPVQAGLGGGSSNAASVLMGLNELLNLKLEKERLIEIGRRLGADVPFFIFKDTALATGVGDRLEKIELPFRFWVVLVDSGTPISSGWAYRNLKLTKRENYISIPKCIDKFSQILSLLSNDLEEVVISRYPEIQQIKERLMENGAEGALMSGSGSVVFGIFSEKGRAQRVFERIRANSKWAATLAHNL